MNLYEEITNRIISEMENGVIPWRKPWVARGAAISHTTGKPYSLLNQMLLGKAGEYITFKQAAAEGGHVKKGAKAKMVCFWKFLETKDEETGEEKKVPLLRYYNVFHLDDCEGIKPKHLAPLPDSVEADEAAESIIAEYVKREGVTLEHQEGDRAYYQPATDKIVLPIIPTRVDDEHFKITVPVAVSRQFYGWVVGLGEGVKIVEPDNIKENMRDFLDGIQKMYKK